MERALQLRPGQQKLTPAQEDEARRFADKRIQAQLSTEPVDEQETERLLRQAYAVARLPPPRRIVWLDGPLQLVGVEAFLGPGWDLAGPSFWQGIEVTESHLWERLTATFGAALWDSLRECVEHRVRTLLWERHQHLLESGIKHSFWFRLEASCMDTFTDTIWDQFRKFDEENPTGWVSHLVWESIRANQQADRLALFRFFDTYFATNDEHPLAYFNERVSGYHLGNKLTLLVRRPCLLERDAQGRLHSETGKCLEYPDGWGFYAWHGVRVPEKIILAPEMLSREDFLSEPNVEVRRVMQERMGQRFVSAVGGEVIDTGPRGTLYEVRLPEDDPEGVARYLQVQDASTPRQYFLRVPPSIQTAAEAVAWSFQVAVDDYHPAQET